MITPSSASGFLFILTTMKRLLIIILFLLIVCGAVAAWIVLGPATDFTSDKKALYNMARQSYMIDNNKPDTSANIADQFIHTQFFALVDKQGRVRGIYDGLKEDEIQKLLKDVKEVLQEKYQSRSL